MRPRLLFLLLLPLLAACAALPRGAAVERDILSVGQAPDATVAVHPVTPAFLPTLATWPAEKSPARAWINGAGTRVQVIRPGDLLDLEIWESGENGLLTANNDRVGKMGGLRVSPGGTIFLPYVGRLHVAGQSPEAARALIQRKLGESVPSVQVQLMLSEGRHHAVDLVAGVRKPGPVTLPEGGLSVLSALSAGGGILPDLRNPQVRLLRGGGVYLSSLEALYAHPELDAGLRGGDRLLVEPDPRYFLALGATGQEAQIPFNRDHLSALDALALTGGLKDTRADPGGLLVLRRYPVGAKGPAVPQVVFALDLMSAEGLFAADAFAIRPGDLLLATESPLSNSATILALFGSALGLARVAE